MHKNKKEPIIIIDGSLYLYRSYYTFKNCFSVLGNSSGAIYGMLRMLYQILKQYKNLTKLVVIFDSSQKTFRNQLFENYKKNRPQMPDLLSAQIPPLFQAIKKIGIKILSIPGIEADDIIGSLASQLEQKGEKVLIISHDKDMIQLVTKNIHILNKKQNIIIKPEYVQDKYGILPIEFIDLLALMGDSSDNIPGVPGIGKKTALLLLNHFSNIKNIYNNLEKIPYLTLRNAKNVAIKLKNNKNIAFLSYQLAKIKLDIDINVTLEEININTSLIKNIFYFFKKYNYK